MFCERWRESAAYHTVVSWKFKIRDKTEVAKHLYRQLSLKFKVNRNPQINFLLIYARFNQLPVSDEYIR